MTPRWCLLFRVTYSDGSIAECSGRSWAETAEMAADALRRSVPLDGANAVSLTVVAVLPWADEHRTRTTAELFAALELP